MRFSSMKSWTVNSYLRSEERWSFKFVCCDINYADALGGSSAQRNNRLCFADLHTHKLLRPRYASQSPTFIFIKSFSNLVCCKLKAGKHRKRPRMAKCIKHCVAKLISLLLLLQFPVLGNRAATFDNFRIIDFSILLLCFDIFDNIDIKHQFFRHFR